MSGRQLSTRRRRPVRFSPSRALRIVDEVASGRCINDIARDRGMPAARTIYRWLRADERFAAAMREARRYQATALADDLLRAAINLYDRAKSGDLQKGESQAFREYSGTLRWFLSKYSPEYGDKPATGVQVIIHSTLPLGPGSQPAETADSGTGYRVIVEAPGHDEP